MSSASLAMGRQTVGRFATDHSIVGIWLGAVAMLVWVMIMVGGATRLTDSGLSITEWQPILGIVPPLSDAAWLEAFEKYKAIPQYVLINKGMTLDAFKAIYWWEWAHRLLGRGIGLVLAVPLALLWWRGLISRPTALAVLAIGGLVGLQGLAGWLMVQSGLGAGKIAVSPYRLTFHLSLAMLILALLVALFLSVMRHGDQPVRLRTSTRSQVLTATALLALMALQIVVGGFVAGTKAGLTYTTWPLMDGQLIPNGLGVLTPWWLNLAENVTTVQFAHRMLAYAVVALALWHAACVWRTADDGAVRLSGAAVAVGVLAQAALGIATLLTVADGRIPLALGVAHQGGAALLLSALVWHVTLLRRTAAPAG
jgi:cytochrome c oxidase assembly protein subunit 15